MNVSPEVLVFHQKYKSGKVFLDDLQLVSDMRSISTRLSSVNLELGHFQVIAATYNISGLKWYFKNLLNASCRTAGQMNSPQLLELLYLPISFNG